MMFCAKKNALKFLLILLFSFVPVVAHAQFQEDKEDKEEMKWERFESATGVFATKFPKLYIYKIFPFRYNKTDVAFSTEIVSSLDGGSATKDKSIMIRAVQTFGDEITSGEAKKILESEARRYAHSVRSIKGKVLANEEVKYNDFLGRRLYITYLENGIKYGMRIRIYITDYSKIEQVLTGPARTMYSYRSDDFFNSIKLFDGMNQLEEPVELGGGWINYTSKNNIFSVKLPPKNSDYSPALPAFKASRTSESMNFEFHDPVRNQKVIYGAYSYKIGQKATYENAKNILFANHITRFVRNASIDSLKTENDIIDGVNIMSTKLIITPPRKLPYINTVFLEVRYQGDTIVVQEILTSAGHARSELPKLLLESIGFHPEKYARASKKKVKKSDDAGNNEETEEEEEEEEEDATPKESYLD